MAWILYLLQNQFGVVEVIHEPYLKIFGGTWGWTADFAFAKRSLIPNGHEIDKISPSAGVNNSSTIQLYSFTPAGILVHQELCRNSLVLLWGVKLSVAFSKYYLLALQRKVLNLQKQHMNPLLLYIFFSNTHIKSQASFKTRCVYCRILNFQNMIWGLWW